MCCCFKNINKKASKSVDYGSGNGGSSRALNTNSNLEGVVECTFCRGVPSVKRKDTERLKMFLQAEKHSLGASH